MKSRKLIVILSSLVMLVGGTLAIGAYINWAAESDAKKYCERVRIGTDIVEVVANFEQEIGRKDESQQKVSTRHYGFPQFGYPRNAHIFVFPGLFMDKAYCQVGLDDTGKVTGKFVEVLHE